MNDDVYSHSHQLTLNVRIGLFYVLSPNE